MADPAPPADAPKVWEPPASDAEFEFTDIESVPEWVDKGWAGFSNGPALQLPAGDLLGGPGPYHTKVARVGDTVKFVAATASKPAHFEVIEGEPDPEDSSKKPPQASAASVEDMLKTGVLTPDDLGPQGKAEVLGRSPHLKGLIEEGKGAPDPIPVGDILKVA